MVVTEYKLYIGVRDVNTRGSDARASCGSLPAGETPWETRRGNSEISARGAGRVLLISGRGDHSSPHHALLIHRLIWNHLRMVRHHSWAHWHGNGHLQGRISGEGDGSPHHHLLFMHRLTWKDLRVVHHNHGWVDWHGHHDSHGHLHACFARLRSTLKPPSLKFAHPSFLSTALATHEAEA